MRRILASCTSRCSIRFICAITSLLNADAPVFSNSLVRACTQIMSEVCHDYRFSTLLKCAISWCELYRHKWLPGAHRLSPINAFTQHRQLCACQRHNSARCLRPYKLAAVQTLQKHAHPFASCQRSLIKSPLRPRKMKTWPDNGLLSSALCTKPLRLVYPRRISVIPATSQICVLAGIIRAGSQPLRERCRHQPRPPR